MRNTPLALILIGLAFSIYSLFIGVTQAVNHIYVVQWRERTVTKALGKMDLAEMRRAFEVPPDELNPVTYVQNLVIVPRSFYKTYSDFELVCFVLGIILLLWGVTEFVVRRRGEGLVTRRRDQGHCISCGYERGGPNAPVPCSECGHG